jgi:hypothetical protein
MDSSLALIQNYKMGPMSFFASNLSALVFMFMSFSAYAKCKNGEVLKQSANQVAPSEIADHVGYCSNHASRDLLHQALCKNLKDCFQPSILEFLKVDADAEPEMRNSNYALSEILHRQSAASDECLKVNDFFNAKLDSSYENYDKKFVAATRDVIWIECLRMLEAQSSAYKLSVNTRHKAETNTEALETLTKEECLAAASGQQPGDRFIYAAVKRHALTKNCEQKKIPRLILRQTLFSESLKDRAGKLKKLLDDGNQAKVITKSPHAIVVSNYRMICLNGKETLQLQTLDSLYNTPWSEAQKAGDWVNGTALLESLLPNTGFTWLSFSD